MSTATNFFRTFVNDRSFIRGAARLLVAPITQAFPTKIADVIALATATGTADVQTVSGTGTVTAGTYSVSLGGNTVSGIAYNATAAQLAAAVAELPGVGVGNVAGTGGALPTTPAILTFSAALGNPGDLSIDSTGLTGGTYTVAHTTPGSPTLALYDAKPGWTDLGATKTGIQITINNAEETFDIDQQLGIIGSQPTTWECSVGTALAESTPERMQVAWEGSGISIDNTPTLPEKEIGFGSPPFYTQRRMAVMFQRPSGLIRAYFFRIVQRTPQESSISHAKTGEQQSIPVRFNCLADTTIVDVKKQFFIIRDQAF